MNNFKKWMAMFMAGVTLLGSTGGTSTAVMALANEEQERVSVGNIYVQKNSPMEKVIRTYSDGSFVTEPVKDISAYATNQVCDHPVRYLEALSTQNDLRTVGTESTCYKKRLVTVNRCKKCNRYGIKTYTVWTYCHKHSYPLFKKTCSVCRYTKK